MTLRTRSIIQLVLTMLLVALVTVLAKKSLQKIDALSFVWLQMLFGILAIAIYTFVIRKLRFPRNIPFKAWLIVVAMGICNFLIVKTLFILALKILPVNTHAYIINFVGIVTMLLSSLLLKEKPTWLQIIGALIAIFGVQVYFQVIPEGNQLTGLLLLVAAVFFLALTNILMRLLHLVYPEKLSSHIVSCVAVFSGGIPLVLFGLTDLSPLQQLSSFDWGVIVANGIIAIALTMNVFNLVMKHLRAFEASILASSGLIFTAIFSIILLGDSLTLNQIVGIVLLFVGIIMVQLQDKKKLKN